jgi:UDP-glucuronate 4-epimerase
LRILVTGGAGFIGSHLIDRLVERGEEVLCLDAFTDFYPAELKRRNIDPHVRSGAIRVIEGDILDGKLLDDVFAEFRPQRTMHLAARVAVGPSVVDPLSYEEVNCRGTLELLMRSVRHGVSQFILASSSSVYGNSDRLPLREDDACVPVSPYGATKRSAELLCQVWHRLHGLAVTCLRLFTVYGPRQRPDMAIHKFVRLMDQGKPIPRYGGGTSLRDYTYVADVVRGMLGALDNVLDCEVINLGESRGVSLNDLIAAVEKVTGRTATVRELPEHAADVRQTRADIAKAKKLLGYDPQWQLEAGLEEFWTWYRRNREIPAPGVR